MASLLEQQRAFAAAVARDDPATSAGAGVRPLVNLDVYRNNSDWQFQNALALSFPVLRRRVGEDYFRQLAAQYRRQFPSRSGDLHWVGREFANFLGQHLAGSEYLWLADLATLEWAREMASVAEERVAVGAEVLAAVATEDLEHLVFTLQPSLQLGASDFPVVSVWLANQGENAPPVDQSAGAEQYLVLLRNETLEVGRLSPSLLTYISRLRDGASLGEATLSAGLDEGGLLAGLQFIFSHGLICGVHSENR